MGTISFRIDTELRRKLTLIRSKLKSTQSQAIKDAIHAYYHHLQLHKKTKKSPEEIFKESGYLGSFENRKDLSVSYKSALAPEPII